MGGSLSGEPRGPFLAARICEPRASSYICGVASDLIVHSTEPLILESRLDLIDGTLTPAGLHFVRWHGSLPKVDAKSYRLEVDGGIGRPASLTREDLRKLPSREVVAVLECAGNGRGLSGWQAPGTQWRTGAVSCSPWRGVPVLALLESAGFNARSAEVVFTGAGDPLVQRSLPMSVLRDLDTIVAWEHDGSPLPPELGAPVRLVVPDWYGMAWIKSLLRIEAVREPWRGRWDREEYALRGPRYPSAPRLTTQLVRSVITGHDATSISGFAWSGAGPIIEVAISIDGGPFVAAQLDSRVGRSWTRWHTASSAAPGRHTVRARAIDAAGSVQPDPAEVPPNDLGYCFNGVVTVDVQR